MITPRTHSGYTIVEVMLFLAISTAMFASVVTALNFQNRRSQFTESVQTFNQKLIDVLNDVDTGYFPSNSDFKCDLVGGTPAITGGAGNNVEQGKNENCIFAGKAIQLSPDSQGADKFKIYTLVGARVTNNSGNIEEVARVEDANITVIPESVSPAAVDSGELSAQTEIKKVIYKSGSTNTLGGGFAILSGFGQNASGSSTGLKSGNIRSVLAAVTGSSLGQTTTQFTGQIANITSTSINSVNSGVLLCFQEPGGSQGRWASILIGGASGYNTTQVTIDDVPGECTT